MMEGARLHVLRSDYHYSPSNFAMGKFAKRITCPIQQVETRIAGCFKPSALMLHQCLLIRDLNRAKFQLVSLCHDHKPTETTATTKPTLSVQSVMLADTAPLATAAATHTCLKADQKRTVLSSRHACKHDTKLVYSYAHRVRLSCAVRLTWIGGVTLCHIADHHTAKGCAKNGCVS